MTAKEALDFLETKVLLLLEHGDNPIACADFRVRIEERRKKPRLTKQSVRDLEESVDGVLYGSGKGSEVIERELRSRFGFVRLGADPVAVAGRVIKRGRIRGGREADIIRDFVSNQTNEQRVGTEAYDRLAEILDAWEVEDWKDNLKSR